MRTTIGSGFVLWAATLAVAVPSAAQEGLELSTFAGVRVPSSDVIDSYNFSPGDTKGEVRQRTTPVVGARIVAWGGAQLGVDLTLDYAAFAGSDIFGANGNVTTGSLRLLVGLIPRTQPASLYVAAGMARVAPGGAAYSSVSVANASWGPVVGAGGRFQLTHTLALRAEVDEYIYSISGTQSPTYPFSQNPAQHDLAVSLGLSVTPLGHGKVAP